MYAMSRSGLLPRVHQRHPTPAGPPTLDTSAPPSLDALVAVLTSEVVAADDRGDDWRPLIDSLRPISNELWGGLDAADAASSGSTAGSGACTATAWPRRSAARCSG